MSGGSELQSEAGRVSYLQRLKLIMLSAVGAWFFFSFRNALQAHPRVAMLDGAVGLLTLLILYLTLRTRPPGRIVLLTHGNFLLSCLGIAAHSQLTGQSLAITQWNLILFPLMAAYQVGARAGMLWGLVAMVTVVGIHTSARVRPAVPEFVPGAFEYFTTNLVLIALATLFGRYFRSSMEAQLEDLRRQTEELREARDRALAADALKSQFVATMSHEIRTPLQGVIGVAQVLAETELEEEQRAMVSTLVNSGRLLKAVVDDILDFSKLQQQGLTLEQVPFCPEQACHEVVALFTPQCQEKNLELIFQVGENPHGLYLGDPLRFRQIVTNLVANAVKFTAVGSVVVDLQGDPSGLNLSVRDTGIGIPEDRQEKIFGAFQQLDSSTTRRFGGSGLGLAICQRLANLFGQRIQLQSQPGKGSVFSLHFPWPLAEAFSHPTGESLTLGTVGLPPLTEEWVRHLADRWKLTWDLEQAQVWLVGVGCAAPPSGRILWVGVPGQATFRSSCIRGQMGETHLTLPLRARDLQQALWPNKFPLSTKASSEALAQHALTVLIADDTVINQKILARMVSSLGHNPRTVSNGAQALELLRQGEQFDMVLMDLHMPVMDGLEATQKIRSGLDRAHQPYIVAVTANTEAEQRKQLLRSGADAFLGKPVEIQDLQTLLAQFQGARAPYSLDASADSLAGAVDSLDAAADSLAGAVDSLDAGVDSLDGGLDT